MRKRLLIFLPILLSAHLYGQHNLSGSRQNSYYTYVYRISPAETISLFKSGMDKADEKYLHTLVDSFLTSDDDKTPALKYGNYLFVRAQRNHLNYDLKTIGDVQYKLINNNRDLVIALHTKLGQLISDAEVFVNNKKIAFDADTKTYRINKRKRTGLIKVYHQGTLYLFPLAKTDVSYYGRRSLWAKVSRVFPLKYIVNPIRRWQQSSGRYYNYFNNETAYEKKFTGFMVFSKPKYKPGDTVKLKAFITSKKGKPVDRSVLLRLTGDDFDVDTVLANIKPYRPGAYEYQFVITDSLDLTLDDKQLITLEELKSSKYNLDEYDGDLDEDEYAAKRKVLMRGKFTHEEYELGSVHFTARRDKEEHQRGNPVSVYLKATDENDMAVMDGRVELVVIRENYSGVKFYGNNVFLPDTLWYHTQSLEPQGETKITIPDSIFPAASFGYRIQCTFLNSNNEYKTQTLSQHFFYPQQRIYFTAQKDSLKIEQLAQQQSEKVAAIIYAVSEKDDTLTQFPIRLPASIQINPYVKYYAVKTDSCEGSFHPRQSRGMVSSLAYRNKDSISIKIANANHLFFWYNIFAGSKVIQRGYTDNLWYVDRVRTAKNYFVSLQYVYAGTVYNEDYTVPYQDKLLNVQVMEPEFIYPGQTVPIQINVSNAAGQPVEDADITAWSYTSKFDNEGAPYVPYLGKIYPGRKRHRNFYPEKEKEKSGASILNWQRWSREMGLDSIEYFRFLHPAGMYNNTEPAKDSITQLAPFVVINGNLQAVHQLYIDEVPYYFSQAQHLQRYSFNVSPGKHALRLRTYNQMIKIDSIWAWKGVKTFLSINADTTRNKMIHIEKMPDSLTNYEKALWSKYMILVENNFDENPATIVQSNHLYLLNRPGGITNNNYSFSRSLLTGPLPVQYSVLSVKNKFSQSFETEGNYLFSITKGLIKQKQLPFGKYAFQSMLDHQMPIYSFQDLVLTEKEVDSLWQDYLDHRSANEELFKNEALNKLNNGQLKVEIPKDHHGNRLFIKNIFLFRYDDPDFVRVYKGISEQLGYVQPGKYRLFFLLKGDDYFIKDSIEIKKDGINYYWADKIVPVKKDSVSVRIAAIVNNREKKWKTAFQEQDLGNIKESFNEKYLDVSGFSKYIFGSVHMKKNGSPLAGASITVKGTKYGTSTDAQGLFRLKVPQKGSIVIAMVGFEALEKGINDAYDYDIKLQESSNALDEVVVVGYSTARRSNLSYSVASISASNMLAGKLPGLLIRGTASVTVDNSPMVIVDGLPFSGRLEELDTALIAGVTVLKPAEATAIYGARAFNGAVLITTRKGNNSKTGAEETASAPANTLRRHFNDAAFWQPKLRTDENGRASFTVTFPDDITNWKTFAIAMADKKQTGFSEKSIKSFKALSATLSLPQFAVEGDSAYIIAKALNYTLDTITVKRKFTINDRVVNEKSFQLRNSVIDTFSVIANQDSLKLAYTILKEDGYFDGEERSIPIYKQGVLETKGFFAALNEDTSFSLSFDTSAGKIKLHAEGSALPVLLDEIESIHKYEYLCNEQLASKLKALLLKKKIYGYLKKDFKEEANITGLIGKLNQNKSQAGLWGWWNNNAPSLWISLHATEALLMAEQQGYKININKSLITDYLVYNLEAYHSQDKMYCLHLLRLLNAKVDFKKYIDTFEKDVPAMNLYEKFQLLQVKQQAGLPVVLDTLVAKFRSTMFGNIYWGEENNRFFDNSVQNTLLMYRLMKSAGGYEKQLQKTANYFLEKRKDGKWRNTYESSLILETILPELMKKDTSSVPVSLAVNNAVPVHSFPYTTELTGTEKLDVRKQGNWPVYFTAYQQHWNKAPAKLTGDFTVNSFFENNNQRMEELKAGEPVTMKVIVDVKADADYVLVEIPVPAGCSYKDKNQQFNNNEVHREYFKTKVSIFCSSLRKGQYTFTVSLLSRYRGSYHLNPAKAEMMYFPVFYGREKIKKISIQ